MPEYLSLLREASVASIYFLFLLVILSLILKGRIKQSELAALFYIWLPLAVIAQIFMTYFRSSLGISNLHIMNIYLMVEFVLIVLILLRIQERIKGKEINYKIWLLILIVGLLLHFLSDFSEIHNAAILFLAIVYFQLTVNYVDLSKIEEIFKDPYTLLHVTIFVKAFGYSYFLIYQIDYKFPLSIFSGVNLIVQILFGLTLLNSYRKFNKK